jgi:hypothetical protein
MNSPNFQQDGGARSINNLVRTVYLSRIAANKIINDCLDHNVLMLFTENKVSLFYYTVPWNCAKLFYLSGMCKR